MMGMAISAGWLPGISSLSEPRKHPPLLWSASAQTQTQTQTHKHDLPIPTYVAGKVREGGKKRCRLAL